MSRARLWLLCFPLLLAGSETAHSLLERLSPPGYSGAELFEGSATANLAGPLAALGLGAVVAACALAVRRHGSTAPPPRWLFAALPPLLFTAQEELEFVACHHRVALLLFRSDFLAGLGLQLPFAFLAWLVAALLLRLTATLAVRLRPELEPRPARARRAFRVRGLERLPSLWLLDDSHGSRGPPSTALS